MTELVYTASFLEDMLSVELESKEEEIFSLCDLLAENPGLGSANLPLSIRQRYGEQVSKLVASPFDVVYEHDMMSDTVFLLGLVHQRASW